MRREKFSGENEKNTCVLGTSMVFYNGVKRAVLCRRRSESVTGAAKWRHEQALERTRTRRPDLYEKYEEKSMAKIDK